jgi:hypothetical protein
VVRFYLHFYLHSNFTSTFTSTPILPPLQFYLHFYLHSDFTSTRILPPLLPPLRFYLHFYLHSDFTSTPIVPPLFPLQIIYTLKVLRWSLVKNLLEDARSTGGRFVENFCCKRRKQRLLWRLYRRSVSQRTYDGTLTYGASLHAFPPLLPKCKSQNTAVRWRPFYKIVPAFRIPPHLVVGAGRRQWAFAAHSDHRSQDCCQNASLRAHSESTTGPYRSNLDSFTRVYIKCYSAKLYKPL